jgi:transcriptional regulator GlxA family with amidase domain
MHNHLVVALAYDRLCTFEFGCVTELFALERPELGVPWYRFAVCAGEPGPIRAAGGITLAAPYTLKLLASADTIMIPGWRDADEVPPAALLRKLRAAYERGARLCSICSGVFVLAAAGVLDGKTVTTHWRYADKLQQRYPQLRVQPARHMSMKGRRSRRRDRRPGSTCCCIWCGAIMAARSPIASRSGSWCHRIARVARRSSCRARCRTTKADVSRS